MRKYLKKMMQSHQMVDLYLRYDEEDICLSGTIEFVGENELIFMNFSEDDGIGKYMWLRLDSIACVSLEKDHEQQEKQQRSAGQLELPLGQWTEKDDLQKKILEYAFQNHLMVELVLRGESFVGNIRELSQDTIEFLEYDVYGKEEGVNGVLLSWIDEIYIGSAACRECEYLRKNNIK